ncbi:MAG: glutamylcysteine synthetase [Ruminococcus sp.]|nr:glutamylcysteine synthetase [Ruminococcus sp.]
MNKEIIYQKLYEKYIRLTENNRDHFIGVEIEMPIVNLNRQAVDFSVVHQLTKAFCKRFDFAVSGIDDKGNAYSAENKDNGDILSYDCSYNNLELSFGREVDLNIIDGRFKEYYAFIQEFFKPYRYTLTGMGVNPYRRYNRNFPVPNGRYRMLFHHLHSYRKYEGLMEFHPFPEFGTFSSASQVQLDVNLRQLPQTLNVMNRLEPLKALLFGNSPLPDYDPDLLCCRDMFWEKSTHGINPKNVGMYDREFGSADEILSYIADTSIYCVERDEKYINFKPINIVEYLQSDAIQGEYYDNGVYRDITVTPRIEDLAYLRTFKFEDLTYRGTIEYRSACTQPIKSAMALPAFHVGLAQRLDSLDELLRNDDVIYGRGYTPAQLRKMLVRRNLPDFIDVDRLYGLLRQIVDLAEDGLRERGLGEEKYLTPLYERIERRECPAEYMLRQTESGVSTEKLILDFAEI